MATNKELATIITYTINKIQEHGSNPIKTLLMKLLYLLDVEFYRQFSKTVTGIQWVFYHYGPYSAQLDRLLNKLPDVEEKNFTSSSGRKGYTYSSESNIDTNEEEFIKIFGYPARNTLHRVLDKWAFEELWAVLDHVYFYTEPMQGAQRGQTLEFSKITKKDINITTLPRIEFPADKLTELRERITEKRAKRKLPQAAAPEIYDKVYLEAMATMTHEEAVTSYIPDGTAVDGPH